jgi:hypothetical protein
LNQIQISHARSTVAITIPLAVLFVPFVRWSNGAEDRAVLLVAALIALCAGLAIWGAYQALAGHSSTLLWLAFGANLGLGMLTLFTFFGVSLLVALGLAAIGVGAARRHHRPLITWGGVIAQTAGFLLFSGLLLLPWTDGDDPTTAQDRPGVVTAQPGAPNHVPASGDGPS